MIAVGQALRLVSKYGEDNQQTHKVWGRFLSNSSLDDEVTMVWGLRATTKIGTSLEADGLE